LGPRASGLFVVIEGPEGAGKSTLVRWLGGQLRVDGRKVVMVREPGGTPIAEAARKLALKSRHDRAFGAELFLFLAARADLVERVIQPALANGQVVIADRFGLSTIAYQVAGRGLPRADVEAALRVATGGLTPDLTLILDVPVTVGRERQRSAGKAQDRIEREDDEFHTRVREAYRSASGPGIVHIDASQPKKAVQDAAWREVAAAIGALSLRSTG
jgi:dTMP kinase